MTQLETDKSIERYLGAVETNMALTDAKAQKQLEEQVENALSHLEQAEEHLHDSERHETNLLRTALGELRVQFALGKMEGAEKLRNLEERIEHGYYTTRSSVKRIKHLTEEEAHALNEKLHNGWKDLKLQIALLDTRIELASETENTLPEATGEIIGDLKVIGRLAKEEAELLTHNFALWFRNTRKAINKRSLRILKAMEHYLLEA